MIARFSCLCLIPAALYLALPGGRAEPVKKEAPSYVRHVRPFLSKYCYECHEPDNAKEGVDVTSYKKLLEGSGRKKKGIVAPGNPDRSKLVRVLEGGEKQMPPRKYKHKPTAEEIRRVREWIAAGAPDDSPRKAEK